MRTLGNVTMDVAITSVVDGAEAAGEAAGDGSGVAAPATVH